MNRAITVVAIRRAFLCGVDRYSVARWGMTVLESETEARGPDAVKSDATIASAMPWSDPRRVPRSY